MQYKQDFETVEISRSDEKFASAKILEVPFPTPNLEW